MNELKQSRTSFLSLSELDAFEESGILRMPGLIPKELCESLTTEISVRLARAGMKVDSSSKSVHSAQPVDRKRLKRHLKRLPLDDLYTETVCGAGSELLGEEPQRTDRQLLLLTLPDSCTSGVPVPWKVPSSMWHTDAPRISTGCAPGIIALSFLNDVEPTGGGTIVVAGSHRLYNSPDFKLASRDFKKNLKRHEFFQTLFSKHDIRPSDLRGFHGTVNEVGVEVTELTGRAGDVVFLDGRILHSITRNVLEVPRMMARGFFSSGQLLRTYEIESQFRQSRQRGSG